MTSKELHEQKIIPLRMELRRLESEYKKLFRKECGEKVGAIASCDNCALSCVLEIGDHNECVGGKCTCCNDWCYSWAPENEVSAFLRKHYHYDFMKIYRLKGVLGSDFLKKCDTPERVQAVMKLLQQVAVFDGKPTEDNTVLDSVHGEKGANNDD